MLVDNSEIADAVKLDPAKLREQTWYEYQLLQLTIGVRFHHPFENRLLIRGPLAYIPVRNIEQAFCHSHSGYSEFYYGQFLDPFTQSPTWVINRFIPYAFIALHKVLDTICGWIISSNGNMPWGFKDKIR